MLVSLKIKKAIEAELKSQKAVLKTLDSQEANYGTNCSEVKENIKESVEYYNKILKDAA